MTLCIFCDFDIIDIHFGTVVRFIYFDITTGFIQFHMTILFTSSLLPGPSCGMHLHHNIKIIFQHFISVKCKVDSQY